MTTRTWRDVWAARTLDPSKGSRLAQLMAADGLDTGFGSVGELAWRAFVARVADRLSLGAGTSVFEVGCGAGAFLFGLAERGCAVAGLDQSAALVDYARQAMPTGEFVQGEAIDVAVEPRATAVLACGVFMYFPDRDYAGQVLDRMAQRATATVAILDVPDQRRRDEALLIRRGTLGEEAYAERYRGLDHLFFEPSWFVSRLNAAGFGSVETEPQAIDGYANARTRFNVFARR